MDNVIEIQTDTINVPAIIAHIEAQITNRKNDGLYQTNPNTLGPLSLHPSNFRLKNAPPKTSPLASIEQTGLDLIVHSYLIEPQFISSTPIIGPFLVMLRKMWNWMSTKWYVLPIIRQQSDYNLQLSLTLNEILLYQESLQGQINQLQTQIAQLQSLKETNN